MQAKLTTALVALMAVQMVLAETPQGLTPLVG